MPAESPAVSTHDQAGCNTAGQTRAFGSASPDWRQQDSGSNGLYDTSDTAGDIAAFLPADPVQYATVPRITRLKSMSLFCTG